MSDGMDPKREPFFQPGMPRYRLEQANIELAAEVVGLRKQVEKLRQENERLREALGLAVVSITDEVRAIAGKLPPEITNDIKRRRCHAALAAAKQVM